MEPVVVGANQSPVRFRVIRDPEHEGLLVCGAGRLDEDGPGCGRRFPSGPDESCHTPGAAVDGFHKFRVMEPGGHQHDGGNIGVGDCSIRHVPRRRADSEPSDGTGHFGTERKPGGCQTDVVGLACRTLEKGRVARRLAPPPEIEGESHKPAGGHGAGIGLRHLFFHRGPGSGHHHCKVAVARPVGFREKKTAGQTDSVPFDGHNIHHGTPPQSGIFKREARPPEPDNPRKPQYKPADPLSIPERQRRAHARLLPRLAPGHITGPAAGSSAPAERKSPEPPFKRSTRIRSPHHHRTISPVPDEAPDRGSP